MKFCKNSISYCLDFCSYYYFILIFLFFLNTHLAYSFETAEFSSTGSMSHITDSRTNNYEIEFFRMSGNGSRAVFLVNQTIRDTRGCFAQQIRIVDTDGTDETVIEQGFTYDTGVGNSCAKNLFELLDISNDGKIIAFVRLNNPEVLEPEIMVYNVDSGEQQTVLTYVPHTARGETNPRIINPQSSRNSATFKISGDGKWIYFLNRFGPFGSPGFTEGPDPSGFTYYKVATDGSGATPILSDFDVPNIPGIDPEAEAIHIGEEIDVNFDASVVTIPISNIGGNAHFFRNLLKITNDTERKILLNFKNFQYHGGSLSDDGVKYAYAQSHIPSTSGGIYIMNTNEPFDPDRVDPNNYPTFSGPVRISGNGEFTVQNLDQGGGSSPSFRWSSIDRVAQVELPGARATDVNGQISEDGQMILFEGVIFSEGRFTEGPGDLIRFDWGQPDVNSTAQVTSVRGDPSLFLIQFGLVPDFTNRYFFNVTGTSTFLFNTPLDTNANEPASIIGFADFRGAVDDGAFEEVDQQANDGIYTDGGIYAGSGFADPDGNVSQFTLRSMVASPGASASFVEFPVRVLPFADHNERTTYIIERTGFTKLENVDAGVELLENPNQTTLYIFLWDRLIVDVENSMGKIWYVRGFEEGRSGLLSIYYTDEDLSTGGFNESSITLLRSDDGGVTWFAVDSEMDVETNQITSSSPINKAALWTIGSSSTFVENWFIYE